MELKEVFVTNKHNKKVRLIAIDTSLCLRLIRGKSKINGYVQDDGKYFLIIKVGQKIDRDSSQELLKYGKVLIEKKQYIKFLQDSLNNLSEDKNINLDEKSSILYTTASNIIEDLFESPSAQNIEKSKEVVNSLMDTILTDDKALESLMKVSSYDYYTYTHSIDVTIYSISLGKELGFDKYELEKLGTSAILHDIGKSKIDYDIVNKPSRLTEKEYEKMKKHPEYGYEMAHSIGIRNKDILSGIRHHHEKLDGKGYPDKLKPKEISLFAKIIAIADIFDALTTRRSYKNAFSSFDALLLMKKEMSHQIDMRILEKFIKLLYFGD